MKEEQAKLAVGLKSALEGADKELKMFIGLDGFVDEIIHVVDKRLDFENFERIPTIAVLGEKINRAAGLSMNFEFVRKQVKLGGNGPIFANALVEYGAGVTYAGAVGNGTVHPVFAGLERNPNCKVLPILEPGHTDALEFEDGKLMLGKYSHLGDITWEYFRDKIGGAAKLAEIADASDLFGMENWTMMPRMSDIFEGLINEVFPLMKTDRRPVAFFDLADPEKRTKDDILRAMKLIGRFSEKFFAVLGLNEKEAFEIADVFGVNHGGDLRKAVDGGFERLGIDCLVVHPTKEAMCRVKDGFFQVDGPFCAKPVLTTGAGDNFNAGFCFGLSLGLCPHQSLLLGVSTSGFYVRNAKSPSKADVIGFLGNWIEGTI